MTSSIKLAQWIRSHVPQKSGGLTHLKLQKLLFYTYGAALAFGHEDEVGSVPFEPWQHGPVNRDVFDAFRQYGAEPLPCLRDRVAGYSPEVEEALQAPLDVYAWLDPWKLRQQSHLEQPWIAASKNKRRTISREDLIEHFKTKYRTEVQLPEYLGLRGSFTLDGVPARRFESISELADVVRRSFG